MMGLFECRMNVCDLLSFVLLCVFFAVSVRDSFRVNRSFFVCDLATNQRIEKRIHNPHTLFQSLSPSSTQIDTLQRMTETESTTVKQQQRQQQQQHKSRHFVKVSNLPKHITESQIHEQFSSCGLIHRIHMLNNTFDHQQQHQQDPNAPPHHPTINPSASCVIEYVIHL